MAEIDLRPEAKAEADAEMATIDAQLKSPKPKPGVIRESLSSLRSILENASGSVAAHLAVKIGSLLLG